MRQKIEEKIWQLVEQYCRNTDRTVIWRRPVVRFADAANPDFLKLRQIITYDHHVPQDYLPEAKNVLSWFLPFLPELAKENQEGNLSSASWADAYLLTNEMAAWVNERLVSYIREEMGCEAAVPFDAGMIGTDNPRSRWSQRHVAHLAGHGTFGLNNMLISDTGSVGRYFSVVTAMEIEPDHPIREERCLWKQDGSCGLCVKKMRGRRSDRNWI